MNRTEFFERAKKHGWEPGKPLSGERLQAFRQELIAYFEGEGRKDIENAPAYLRQKPVEDMVNTLLTEVTAGG